jgi:predicted transposase YdaD
LPPATELKVIDADVSTIGPSADKVIQVIAPQPYIAHLEFQSGADAELDARMLLYNVLLRWRHKLPVRSVVILLRPQAESRGTTGSVVEVLDADAKLEFRYRVVRLWQQSVDGVMAGGLGTLPLAPIAAVKKADLPRVVEEMRERFEREAAPAEIADAWAATLILMGLRYSLQVGHQLLKGVRNMKESVTYQAIIEEGEAQGIAKGEIMEARSLLLRLGRRRFGPPPATVTQMIDGIRDLSRLEAIAEQIVDASGWDDLIAK